MTVERYKDDNGMRKLLEKARRDFRIPENVNHYSEEDFRKAEKRYLKICVVEGRCPMPS